jgi:hypothetical protein
MWFGLGTRIGAKSRLPKMSDMSDGHDEIEAHKGWKSAEKTCGCYVDTGKGDETTPPQ